MLRKLAETLRFLRYGPTQLAEARARVAGLEQALAAHQAATRQGFADISQQSAAALDEAVRKADADLQRETSWLRNQLGALTSALDRVQVAGASGGAREAPSEVAAQEGFYPALEDRFRGSAQHLRQRLAAYEPWLKGLPGGPVGDLGCGRGEWLELVAQWGLEGRGVDLNTLNVLQARQRGLQADVDDAVHWLQAQPADSFAALTSFHVVEHLQFGTLLRLVQEARRALRPGGRLILETPNPENLEVATQTFWLDPSHQHPLPPALLELVVQHAGLELETTLRLNPPAGGNEIGDAALRTLMTQGRDYAVVARKAQVAAQ
jgi:SAM-dependent methyltransferase